jgi:NAD(P)H-hydrate epimerase
MTKLLDLTETPLPVLPARKAVSHKGDYGRALLIGGSTGMSGAIAMAGLATLRSGAGLVTLAVPRGIQDVVAGFSPCYMTHGLPELDGQVVASGTGEAISLGANATAIALGPGLGRSSDATEFVGQLYREIKQPMVVDADALFALSEEATVFSTPGGPRILTPHPGEFGPLATRVTGTWDAALSAKTGDDSHRTMSAACLANNDPTRLTIVVLKGHRTVITDGERYAINQTGNAGMATGGSGDVLTGVITALLCQGLSPFDGARLGVHVHGLAGDLAALELGQVSLVATDIIDYLPQAFQAIGG